MEQVVAAGVSALYAVSGELRRVATIAAATADAGARASTPSGSTASRGTARDSTANDSIPSGSNGAAIPHDPVGLRRSTGDAPSTSARGAQERTWH
ncbi:MAG: hypothetical protein M3Q27_12035 [Actinomycetota bacterium]|nr:hypothetical protein [Actinomycetota bacterium]